MPRLPADNDSLLGLSHDASLGLLGPPRLRYRAFRRAMDAHAACQQRYGR